MPNPILKRARRRLAEGFDLALARTALAPRGPSELGHEQRMAVLALLERCYGRLEFFTQPNAAFFAPPAAIAPKLTRVRTLGDDCEVIDLRWPSEFEPIWSAAELDLACEALASEQPGRASAFRDAAQRLARRGDFRAHYLGVQPNRNAFARWFRHRGAPRACALGLHGYMGGNFAFEERTWPLRKLLRAGLDVVLTVLPFHGPRRDPRRGLRPPAFPGSDPRLTVEGMRQIVLDHRALFGYLVGEGCPALGVMGMSLGGYSAALLTTLESELQFAVLLVPMASIAEFAREHGAMVGSDAEQRAQTEALSRVQRVVSPLARPTQVVKERALVIAGVHDRVVGLAHSQPLARHFGVELTTFDGGHVLQLGRGAAFEPVFAMLERAGLARPGSSA